MGKGERGVVPGALDISRMKAGRVEIEVAIRELKVGYIPLRAMWPARSFGCQATCLRSRKVAR